MCIIQQRPYEAHHNTLCMSAYCAILISTSCIVGIITRYVLSLSFSSRKSKAAMSSSSQRLVSRGNKDGQCNLIFYASMHCAVRERDLQTCAQRDVASVEAIYTLLFNLGNPYYRSSSPLKLPHFVFTSIAPSIKLSRLP